MHAVGGSKCDERNTRSDQSYITLKELHDSLFVNDVEILLRIPNIHIGNEERNRRNTLDKLKYRVVMEVQIHTEENKILCF